MKKLSTFSAILANLTKRLIQVQLLFWLLSALEIEKFLEYEKQYSYFLHYPLIVAFIFFFVAVTHDTIRNFK